MGKRRKKTVWLMLPTREELDDLARATPKRAPPQRVSRTCYRGERKEWALMVVREMFEAGKTDAEIGARLKLGLQAVRKYRCSLGLYRERPAPKAPPPDIPVTVTTPFDFELDDEVEEETPGWQIYYPELSFYERIFQMYRDGYVPEEIAKLLDIGEESVKKSLFRMADKKEVDARYGRI